MRSDREKHKQLMFGINYGVIGAIRNKGMTHNFSAMFGQQPMIGLRSLSVGRHWQYGVDEITCMRLFTRRRDAFRWAKKLTKTTESVAIYFFKNLIPTYRVYVNVCSTWKWFSHPITLADGRLPTADYVK